MRLGKYIKTAFWNHWNLLAVIGASAFAVVSGKPDIVLPLVAAGELAYLGFVATHPKFQTYVDVLEARHRLSADNAQARQALQRIQETLSKEDMQRFEALRKRCLKLQRIADDLKGPNMANRPSLERLQNDGLDRLLWVYLRLLFTKHALTMFFQSTDADRIRRDIRQGEQRLEGLAKEPSTRHNDKLKLTLDDNLATSRQRLENYQKALANFEFVNLELDRLENKIQSLAEMAVNRQDPDYISSQVSAVASSMLETEATMSELDFITHLGQPDDQPPQLMQPSMQTQH